MTSNLSHRGDERIWLVIEGDNGSGKDTLANQLGICGFEVINSFPLARSREQRARIRSDAARVTAFLEYNRTCAELAGSIARAVQIRYWPSTLAAAYADEIMTWEQIQAAAARQSASALQPNMFLYLECSHEVRAKRITDRGAQLGKIDSLSLRRAARHKSAMTYFSMQLDKWFNLDSTHLTPKEVLTEAIKIMKNQIGSI